MKVYILDEADFSRLLAEIDRDPQYGRDGGSSRILSDRDREVFKSVHAFYNYTIRKWVDGVKT